MITNISSWAKGIIIAVMIGTVLETCLPENKNKKYIKVVIGLYILFCIINPVIGKSLNIENFNFEKYLINNTNSTSTISQDKSNEKNIDKILQDRISKQIKKELNTNGYDSNKIKVKCDENYNIVSIDICEIFEYKKENQSINKIEINIKDKPAKGIAFSDKQKIISNLKDTYKIDESKITIN